MPTVDQLLSASTSYRPIRFARMYARDAKAELEMAERTANLGRQVHNGAAASRPVDPEKLRALRRTVEETEKGERNKAAGACEGLCNWARR